MERWQRVTEWTGRTEWDLPHEVWVERRPGWGPFPDEAWAVFHRVGGRGRGPKRLAATSEADALRIAEELRAGIPHVRWECGATPPAAPPGQR